MKFKDFEKKYAITGEHKSRKPVELFSLKLPLNSALGIYRMDSEVTFPKEDDYLLRGHQSLLYNIRDINLSGAAKKFLSSIATKFITKYKKEEGIVKITNKLSSSKDKLLVINNGLVNPLTTFNVSKTGSYDRWLFNLNTTYSFMEMVEDKNKFILFTIDKILPSVSELKRMLEYDEIRLNKLSYTMLNTLHLFKILNGLRPSAASLNYIVTDGVRCKVISDATIHKIGDKIEEFKSGEPLTTFSKMLEDITKIEVKDEPIIKVKEKDTKQIRDIKNKVEKTLIASGATNTSIAKIEKAIEEIPHKDVSVSTEDMKVVIEPLPDRPYILDKDMLADPIGSIDKQYFDKIHDNLLTLSITSATKVGFLVSGIEEESIVDINNDNTKYTINYKTIDGKRGSYKLLVPNFKEDGSFILYGKSYRMRRQRVDLPVRKIGAKRAALTSSYGKILFNKSRLASKSPSKFLIKELTLALQRDEDPISMLLQVDNKHQEGVKLPYLYGLITEHVRSFNYKGVLFSFDYASREHPKLKELESKYGVMIAHDGEVTYHLDDKDELIKVDGTEITHEGNFLEYLKLDFLALPPETIDVSIFGNNLTIAIPLIFWLGLDGLLDMLDIQYSTGKTIFNNNRLVKIEHDKDEFVIYFKDMYYKFSSKDGYKSAVMYGLTFIKGLETVNADPKKRGRELGPMLSLVDLKEYQIMELELSEDMFVDPVTDMLLEELGEPDTLPELYIRIAEIIIDYNYSNVNDISEQRIRGGERFNSLIYHTMVTAIRSSMTNGGKISMSPYALIDLLNSDGITNMEDDMNPITYLAGREAVSYLGVGGRSETTMNKSAKAYHVGDVGVVSEANVDSGSVGTTAGLSAIPLIDNVYGVRSKGKLKPANYLSTSNSLRPKMTGDDFKRANFTTIMDKSYTPSESDIVLPYRTGGEVTIGDRLNNKFCINAKQAGKVLSVGKELKVEYKDGTKKTYSLSEWTGKEEGGSASLHKVITFLEKGDTFAPGDNLTHDKLSFGPDIFNPKGVAIRLGSLINIIMLEVDESYEDSMAVTYDYIKNKVVEYTDTYSYVVEADTRLNAVKQPGDILPHDTEFFVEGVSSSDVMDKETVKLLAQLSKQYKTKKGGEVLKIDIRYNCRLSDMSASIRKLADAADKETMRTKGVTNQVDNSYSINGVTLPEGSVEIKYYLKVKSKPSIADKHVLFYQLKCTIGKLMKDEILLNGKYKAQGIFSPTSAEARIVTTPKLVGSVNTLLVYGTREICEEYNK